MRLIHLELGHSMDLLQTYLSFVLEMLLFGDKGLTQISRFSTGGAQTDDGCNKPNAKYHKRHHESQSTKEFQSSEFAGKGRS